MEEKLGDRLLLTVEGPGVGGGVGQVVWLDGQDQRACTECGL
ncbi:hypothetical protein EVA_13316 [gut metagenome]|uniref:Uncharacterized protein n=1 Tax=gut metagenome TaxID=749906 RepID=J9GGU4_9ZZZZ